jgi:hypothetical protein
VDAAHHGCPLAAAAHPSPQAIEENYCRQLCAASQHLAFAKVLAFILARKHFHTPKLINAKTGSSWSVCNCSPRRVRRKSVWQLQSIQG